MRAPLAKLQPRHAAARALAAKVGWSCAELSESTALHWNYKRLDATEMATLAMLFSTGALARAGILGLTYSRFGPVGGLALLDGLGCGDAPQLIVLGLHSTGLGTAGAFGLAAALGRGALPKLEELYIGRNEMGDEAFAALAPALRRRPGLRRLFLPQNRLRDAGVAALLDDLGAKELTQLETLNLSDNQITDAGCATLTTAIQGGRLPALRLQLWRSPTVDNLASAAATLAVRDALVANEARAV